MQASDADQAYTQALLGDEVPGTQKEKGTVSQDTHSQLKTDVLANRHSCCEGSFKQWKITGSLLNNKRKHEEVTTFHMQMHGMNGAMGGRLQSNMQSC